MRFLSTLLLSVMIAAAANRAAAHEYKVGPLQIGHPWSRATPKGAPVAGGYLKITNNGTAADRLIGGSSEVADRFEIHQMAVTGGVMTMRPLPNGLEIKPGETVELKPGGLHLMFVGLKKPVVQDERFKGTLVFEKAGKVDVEYAVSAAGAPASGGGHHGH